MHNDTLSPFGEMLKTFRLRRHLTQQQLADQLGAHRNTIANWERGDFLPNHKSLVLELSRLLHLDAAETDRFLEASFTAPSPHWGIPFARNQCFTGREEILEELHTHLYADQATALIRSCALSGLGGVGKTQIALEYVYRYAFEYDALFWIEAETPEQIMSSMLRIAEVLQLPECAQADQQRVATAVQRWLTSQSRWLLIWDNLEDPALLHRFVPPVRQGAQLITTRGQALGTLAWGIELSPMGREEGTLLLLRRAKALGPEATHEHVQQFTMSMPGESAAAEELVTMLEGLPLALDQAGAYIEETGCSFAAHVEHYRHRRGELLARRGIFGEDHPASVVATLSLACERAAQRHPAAADLLRCCAFLHADAIPEELFVHGTAYQDTLLQSMADDPYQLDLVLAALRAFSLVQRQGETRTFSLHRIVQAILQEDMSEQEQRQWQLRMIRALHELFLEVTSTAWRQNGRFLPHVLACVTAIPDHVMDQDLASLLRKAANYLRLCAQYEPAGRFYQRALRILEHLLGPTHPDVGRLLGDYAYYFYEQGKYDQAETAYLRVLNIWEQALAPDNLKVTYSLNGLAHLYYQQGKYTQAEALYQRALNICEQASEPAQTRMAIALLGLGNISYERGEYKQSEVLYQRSRHIWEQALGPEHPDAIMPLENLASLYHDWGKYESAEPLYQQVIHTLEQVHGPEHPHVAVPLENLAGLYQEQGRYEQAEQLHQRVLRIWDQAWGSEHPFLVHPFNGLAHIAHEQGNDEQAEALYQQALRLCEQTLGSEHPDVASSLHGLAKLYRDQGKYELAEPLYTRALAIRERHQGPGHPETAKILVGLARLYERQGKAEQAECCSQRAYSIFEQYFGSKHPERFMLERRP